MKTVEFLSKIKELLDVRGNPKDWMAFSAFCTEEKISIWYRLGYRFYAAAIGRTFSREVVSNMLLVLCAGIFAQQSKSTSIEVKAWEGLNKLFLEDSTLHRIQRFFTEFTALQYKTKSKEVRIITLEVLFAQLPGKTFQGRFLQLCSLIAGKNDYDLISQLDILAYDMLRTRFMHEFETTVALLYGNNQTVELSSQVLVGLRDTANTLALVGSLTMLPEVPETDLTLKNPAIQEIRNAVIKYSADTVLRSHLAVKPLNIQHNLDEIADIFKDFGNGTYRKKYLRLFAQTVKAGL